MPKKIVICSDGTWNKWERGDEKNTNVARLWDALVNDDKLVNDKEKRQVTFYDPGVGTGLSKYIGGATGFGISKNIRDCYGALIERYKSGDEIFLFGFSRGAYTVRSLAGLIHACGLPKSNDEKIIKRAYDLYRDKNNIDKKREFKKEYARDVHVKMIGVWDTVGALGIPVSFLNAFNPFFDTFHDTKLNHALKFGYHALAIDEQRKAFAPALWDETNKAADQTIEQVWFPGVHSDVGGGYPERGLADISLQWMIGKACDLGLVLKPNASANIKPDHDAYLHDPRAGIAKRIVLRKEVRSLDVLHNGQRPSVHIATQVRANSTHCIPNPKYVPKNITLPTDLKQNYVVATTEDSPRRLDLDTAA